MDEKNMPDSFKRIYEAKKTFNKPLIDITCHSAEEAEILFEYLEEYGYRWADGMPLGNNTYWNINTEVMVYFIYENKLIRKGRPSDIDKGEIQCPEIFDEIEEMNNPSKYKLDVSSILEVF